MPKKSFCRKHGINSFCVRIRRTRAAIFQKATLATAAGGGRREQGLAPRSAIGEAACPPMTEPGTARGSQGFAFLKIRKGEAAAHRAAALRETLSSGFLIRRDAAFVQLSIHKPVFRRAETPPDSLSGGAVLQNFICRENDPAVKFILPGSARCRT